jgi:hypothetical protein
MIAGYVARTTDAPARAVKGRAIVELLLVGGATPVLFALSWVMRRALGADAAELAVGFTMFHAALLINDPHFAVTYLLFYKDARARLLGDGVPRAQRARYAVAGVVVPIALVAWAVLALRARSASALGWMIQLMFLLVGWHYAKQAFGVVTVLSARRGVTFAPRERKTLLAHCFAAWAFAWANPTAPAMEVEEKGVVYTTLAHPRWLEVGTGAVLAVSTVALLVVLARRWRRDPRGAPYGPLFAFLVTIWSWTIFTSLDPLVTYMIPALHSVQYLYFVWLMRSNEARAHEGPPSFGRPVAVRVGALAVSAVALGWVLLHGAPSFFDAALVPRGLGGPLHPLGETPVFAAIFVVVNVHHYFMDHVIWRRENPDTRYLREPSASDADATAHAATHA